MIRCAVTLIEAYERTREKVGFPAHVAVVEGEAGPGGRVVAFYTGPGQSELRADEEPGPGRYCIVGYVPALGVDKQSSMVRLLSIAIWGLGRTWDEAIAVAGKAFKHPPRVTMRLRIADPL